MSDPVEQGEQVDVQALIESLRSEGRPAAAEIVEALQAELEAARERERIALKHEKALNSELRAAREREKGLREQIECLRGDIYLYGIGEISKDSLINAPWAQSEGAQS